MRLRDLQAAERNVRVARHILRALNETKRVGIDLENERADSISDYHIEMDDPAFVDAVKAAVRADQTRLLEEATAKLVAAGIEIEPDHLADDETEEEEEYA